MILIKKPQELEERERSCCLLWQRKFLKEEVREKSMERKDGEQEKKRKSRAFIARK